MYALLGAAIHCSSIYSTLSVSRGFDLNQLFLTYTRNTSIIQHTLFQNVLYFTKRVISLGVIAASKA